MDNQDLKQPVTKEYLRDYLGEFTEKSLLPAMSSMMDEKNKALKKDIDDSLTDKLADLKGDLVVLMRKEDRKLGALIELLKTKHVISDEDAKQILSLEPFPKT